MAGNATVTLYDKKTKRMKDYDIWIVAFNTASQNEFMTQQVRDGIQWIPIRRAEMQVYFTAVWSLVAAVDQNGSRSRGFEGYNPADGFGKMNKFQDAIRDHQVAFIQGTTDQPMTLNYWNNSDPNSPIYNTLISKDPLDHLLYDGIIKVVEKQYVRFQNVFYTNYMMTIKNPNVAQTPNTSGAIAGIGENGAINYAPTTSDQEKYGDDWLNINNLVAGSQIAYQQIVQGQ